MTLETQPPADAASPHAAMPPPWVAFPELRPGDWPQRQGVVELYVVQEFGPYWSALDADGRAAYLAHWNAPPAWRERFAFVELMEAQATAEDAAESELWLAAHRDARAAERRRRRPWWRRLFGR